MYDFFSLLSSSLLPPALYACLVDCQGRSRVCLIESGERKKKPERIQKKKKKKKRRAKVIKKKSVYLCTRALFTIHSSLLVI